MFRLKLETSSNLFSSPKILSRGTNTDHILADSLCGPNSIQWEMFCNFVTQEHLRPDDDDYFGDALLKFLSQGLPELQAQPTLQYGLLDLSHEFRSRYATV